MVDKVSGTRGVCVCGGGGGAQTTNNTNLQLGGSSFKVKGPLL